MNAGDFVYIDYVGRVKDTGEIFDITKEDLAKKENLYRENFKYGPVAVIIDSDLILPGLNEEIKKMTVGEKKTFEVKPEKAFGERNPELIKLIPESTFKQQDIDAVPGSYVTINRMRGRIASVDGGRVRVDFNHPLAGKILLYEVEVAGEIKESEGKIKAVICYFTGLDNEDVDLKMAAGEAEIIFKKKINLPIEGKEMAAKNILKWVSGMEKVKFSEVFEK
jgi:FKBP-type peptidyl-prolyl cis-trans isomerase 2